MQGSKVLWKGFIIRDSKIFFLNDNNHKYTMDLNLHMTYYMRLHTNYTQQFTKDKKVIGLFLKLLKAAYNENMEILIKIIKQLHIL